MKEKLKPIEIDLPKRKELRFIFPLEKQNKILKLLQKNFEPLFFSDRNISRTIYFNNQYHEVPWGYSFKARQYFNKPSLKDGDELDFNENYFLEIKSSIGDFGKSKERYEMNLNQASKFLSEDISIIGLTAPLRPYIADEYQRWHFQIKGSDSGLTRITCDVNPSYFLIGENKIFHFLKNEPVIRLEIKIASGQEIIEINNFIDQIEALGGRKTISKKMAAYSLESSYYKRADGFIPQKELKGVEMESKLIVTDQKPFSFFNCLVRRMEKGNEEFLIPEKFPYIVESGSFNSYYLPEGETDSEGIKFLSRPTLTKTVLKSETEIVEDPYQLGCILKRKEFKGKFFPLVQNQIDQKLEIEEKKLGKKYRLVGEIERLRKAFWVDNKNSLRTYHISIDQCSSENKTFYQLEIEYSGTKGQMADNAEKEIIKDISRLTKFIIENFPNSVKPSILTKLEWLHYE